MPIDDIGKVHYRVMSPDFSSAHTWEEIGQLLIDIDSQEFAFDCTGAWAGQRVVPPWVYGLPDSEMRHLLNGEFAGFGYGAWSGRIRSIARHLIRSGNFPDKF